MTKKPNANQPREGQTSVYLDAAELEALRRHCGAEEKRTGIRLPLSHAIRRMVRKGLRL